MARRSTPRPAGRDAAVRGAAGRLRPLPLSRVYRLLEPGPVVLVTDRVDSRWTVTLAGHLLRTAGAGPVHPLALLQSVGGAGD